ncbi:MAG: hypothetical protein Kow009_07100 [Spirochaetales bacterium]
MKVLRVWLLLFIVLSPLSGAECLLNEPSELRIGVAEFQTRVESPTMKQVGRTVGRTFLERLQYLTKKRIGSVERRGFVRGLLKRTRISELKRLDELLRKRDQVALFTHTEQERSTYVVLTEQIHESLQRIQDLEKLDPVGTPLEEEEKPLKWADVNEKGELLPPVRSTYRNACKEARIDYLVSGEVEEVYEDVFSLRVVLYSDIAEEVLYEKETMGTSDEVETLVEQLLPDVVTIILGMEWGSLEIRVQPSDAGIFLDGSLVGIGTVRKPFLPVGVYHVEVQRSGYQMITQEVSLVPHQWSRLDLSMEPLSLSPMRITSLPEGASVYLGAQRGGDTPLFLDAADSDSIGRIEKEGYKSYVFPVESGEGQGQDMQVVLPKDLVPWKARIEKKREDFYKAFGWFVLSLPLPVLLYGYYENESFRYIQYSNSGGYDPTKEADWTNRLDGIYFGYLGTLFLSSSLLVNAIVSLVDYLQTGEASVTYPDQKP